MTDPRLVAADPGPTAAPELPSLAKAYPACFNWDHPRPFKIGIHKDLLAAGLGGEGVRRADLSQVIGDYCNRRAYRKALRPGAIRVDLHSPPAGEVTAAEAVWVRVARAHRAGLPDPPRLDDPTLPPHDTNAVELSLCHSFGFIDLPFIDGLF